MARTPLFTEEVTHGTIADLQDSDFLMVIPSQNGMQGVSVQSGVAALDEDHTWGVRSGYRRPLFPIPARRFRTLRGAELSVPSSATCTFRRKLTNLV